MQIPIAFADQPTVQESLIVKRKLSQGKFSIYEVYSPSQNTIYAMKLFPNDSFGLSQYQNEKLMFHLDHPNIIRNVPVIFNDKGFHIILSEFAKYGDFFNLVAKGFLYNDTMIRTFFHQLIEGIEHIHSNGIAHLDLKLENLMLGSDFRLKIIDFDQSQPIVEKKIMSGGTRCYRAPEILLGSCQNLAAVDIYSAGIILYIFKVGRFPFLELEGQHEKYLKMYNMFLQQNKMFWELRARKRADKNFFDPDFIELVNGMLDCDPEKRMTIQEIKRSKWYNGPVFGLKELRGKIGVQYQCGS